MVTVLTERSSLGSLDDLANHACPTRHFLAHRVDLDLDGLVENIGESLGDRFGGEDQVVEDLGDARPASARGGSRRGRGGRRNVEGGTEGLRGRDGRAEKSQGEESQKQKQKNEGARFFHGRRRAC